MCTFTCIAIREKTHTYRHTHTHTQKKISFSVTVTGDALSFAVVVVVVVVFFLKYYYFVLAFVSNRDMSSLFSFFCFWYRWKCHYWSHIITILFDVIIGLGEKHLVQFFFFFWFVTSGSFFLSFVDLIHSLDITSSVINTRDLLVSVLLLLLSLLYEL